MKPDWSKNGVDLYCGNCLGILPQIGTVEHVITDPPFSAVTHTNAKSNRNLGYGNKAIDFQAIDFQAISEVVVALARNCQRWFVATMDWRHITQFERTPPDGWEFVRFGVFVKTNPMPQISADRPANGWDGICYMHRTGIKKRWNGGGAHGNWIDSVVTNGDHPTGKPLPLFSMFVERFTDTAETVLDPFMGSGTTGVACVRLGRKFIGVEVDERYFAIAVSRIEKAMDETALLDYAQAQEQLEISHD
jgi:site-specific DNA-methyltransferase (adenine-specific)